MTRERIDVFLKRHASSAKTLDIGCANSPYSALFPNRIGLDIEPGQYVDVVGDAHALPFPEASFEQILCSEVLEHLHSPERAIAEMRRVLVPGGTLILTTRFLQAIHDAPGDYFRFTEFGLKYLLRDFELVEFQNELTPAETLGSLLQRFAMQSDLRGGSFTKVLLLCLARAAAPLQWLVKKQYGTRHTGRTYEMASVMTTGYHLFARKPQ